MSPVGRLRTYEKRERKDLSNRSKSVEAVNALFAENLTKRLIGKTRKKKPKIVIKELPPRTETYLTDDSIKVSTDDTFDKLLKGEVYNNIGVKDCFVKLTSSESEASSRSKIKQVSQFYSPVITRRRKRQAQLVISEISSPSEASLKHVNHLTLFTKPVEKSLSVENVAKKNVNNQDFSSLSYISENVSDKVINTNRMEASYEPIFSDTFKERQAVHSSTPYLVATKPKIIANAISPISKQDISSCSKLIDQSYDEIRKWDSNFPFDAPKHVTRHSTRNLSTPVVHSVIRRTRRKSTAAEPKDEVDWKLQAEPEVYLRHCETPVFKGFEEKDCNSDLIAFKLQSKKLLSDAEKSSKIRKKIKTDPSGSKKSKTISCRGSQRSGKTEVIRHRYLTRSKAEMANQNNSTGSNNKKVGVTSEVGQTKFRCCTVNIEKSANVRGNKGKKVSGSQMNSKNNLISKEEIISAGHKDIKNSLEINKNSVQDLEIITISDLSDSVLEESINGDSAKSKKVNTKCVSTRIMKRSRSCFQESTSESSCVVKVSSFETTQENSTNALSQTHKISVGDRTRRRAKRNFSLQKVRSETSMTATEKSPSTDLSKTDELQSKTSSDFAGSFSEKSRKFSGSVNKTNLLSSTASSSILSAYISRSSRKPCFWNVEDASGSSSDHFKTSSNINLEMLLLPPNKASDCVNWSDLSAESDQIESLVTDLEDLEQFDGNVTTNLEKFDKFYDSCYNEVVRKQEDEDQVEWLGTTKKQPLPKPVTQLSNIDTDLTPKSNCRSRVEEFKKIYKTEYPQDDQEIVINNDDVTENIDVDTSKLVLHDHSYSSPVNHLPGLKFSRLSRITKMERKRSTNIISNSTSRSSNMSDILESSQLHDLPGSSQKMNRNSIILKPGKLYRRSLSFLRRSTMVIGTFKKGACPLGCVCVKCVFKRSIGQVSLQSHLSGNCSRCPSHIVPASNQRISLLEVYAHSYVQEQELTGANLEDSIRGLSLNSRHSLVIEEANVPVVTAKDIVLRRCGQTEPKSFLECYPDSLLKNCRKIGEGVYGEVFLFRNKDGATSVMKVIPIEGDQIVNGERQKKFHEILSEIIIAMELSNLRNSRTDSTSGFSEVQKVNCVQGRYPERLLDLWDLYDETRGSENDSPQMFTDKQLYIVLELADCGQDMEAFVFYNALQAVALFEQTACALAVAESQLKFEHRDLHWGNILINNVETDKKLKFSLQGKEIEVATQGVEVSVIDFTLSRIEFDGVVIFNDLSLDNELFSATGDYQFEIYRLMQKANGNEWHHFEPYSNVLWLHYVLDKATSALRYQHPRSKAHKKNFAKLIKYKEEILSFSSVVDFVNGRLL